MRLPTTTSRIRLLLSGTSTVDRSCSIVAEAEQPQAQLLLQEKYTPHSFLPIGKLKVRHICFCSSEFMKAPKRYSWCIWNVDAPCWCQFWAATVFLSKRHLKQRWCIFCPPCKEHYKLNIGNHYIWRVTLGSSMSPKLEKTVRINTRAMFGWSVLWV
jgi:hypothetical protein